MPKNFDSWRKVPIFALAFSDKLCLTAHSSIG